MIYLFLKFIHSIWLIVSVSFFLYINLLYVEMNEVNWIEFFEVKILKSLYQVVHIVYGFFCHDLNPLSSDLAQYLYSWADKKKKKNPQ